MQIDTGVVGERFNQAVHALLRIDAGGASVQGEDLEGTNESAEEGESKNTHENDKREHWSLFSYREMEFTH